MQEFEFYLQLILAVLVVVSYLLLYKYDSQMRLAIKNQNKQPFNLQQSDNCTILKTISHEESWLLAK